MIKTLKIIGNVILILIIVTLSSYIVLRFFRKLDIYKVETGSMEEGIHRGDYLLVIKQDHYKVNDVVTYESGGKHITHRIMEINGSKVITKGDANNTIDEEIDESAIIGRLLYKGTLLNILINYKFVIISVFISGYLVTLYLDEEKIKKKARMRK